MRHAGMDTFDQYGRPAFGLFCYFGIVFGVIAASMWAGFGDRELQAVWIFALAPFVATPGVIALMITLDVVCYVYDRMDDYFPRWLTRRIW